MATNKHAVIRYQALDRCFRNLARRFYIEDLIDACNKAVYDYTGKHPNFQRRQIFNDINFMESSEGYGVLIDRIPDGRRKYYRYTNDKQSINNGRPLTDKEMDLLSQTVAMLHRFKGLPQFDWMESLLTNLEDKFNLHGNTDNVIGFEQNIDYVAVNYLCDLFFAIINKQVLHIQYRSFKGLDEDWILHPYYIKQYNNRWFLFGRNADYGNITNVPLDRIVTFEVLDIPYIDNTLVDFEEYFDDIIGVTFPKKREVVPIRLKFTEERFPYILSKPLHGSMKIIDKENRIIELSIMPNKEFESLILSFGNQVEVIVPEWFRKQIQDKIKDMMKIYYTCAQ